MPNDPKITDLRKLAEEAAAEAYDQRAISCWPWSHRWTMWKPLEGSIMYQTRRCLRCGKTKDILR